MTYKITTCLCCGSDKIKITLDLGNQPLANNYIKTLDQVEERYPLAINFCQDCTHIQLTHSVDPDLLFRNYLYVSGTTATLTEYFRDFVDLVRSYVSGMNVLDIACNDGTQLDMFKEKGYKTYGIDPAENLFALSSKNHTVICDYFNQQSVKKLSGQKFNAIVAQNVFAHNCYPKEFLEQCAVILEDDGKIFIQTSQADMIQNNQFDTIYHEHISFFSVRSMLALCRRSGLYLQDVLRTSVHGTSFVFVISKFGPELSKEKIDREFVLDWSVMDHYAEKCHSIAKETKLFVDKLCDQGYKVIGYGAAAKGNTFINYADISKLAYIIDDNPLKINLYVPGAKIPIVGIDKLLLENDQKICVIPLAWNFFQEIKNRVSKICQHVTLKELIYLKYFPEVEIINV